MSVIPLGLVRGIAAVFGVSAIIAAYWWRPGGWRFAGLDELVVLSSFARAETFGDFAYALMAPHNRHFAPVFKLLFLAEYFLYGLAPIGYHVVTYLLYAVSALLLYRFVRGEVNDGFTAIVAAVLFSLNAAYYEVVAWVFLQQFSLTLIFIELSLLSARSALLRRKVPWGSAVFSLLSSFCLGFGALSWLFTAVYYALGASAQAGAGGRTWRRTAVDLLPLFASAAASFFAYAYVMEEFSGYYVRTGGGVFLVAHGVVVGIGNLMLETLGFYYFLKHATSAFGVGIEASMPIIRMSIHAAFVIFIGGMLLALGRVGSRGRLLVLGFIGSALFSQAVIVHATAFQNENDVYAVTNVIRYNYFPFFFMVVGIAPTIALSGRPTRSWVVVLVVLWALLQHSIYTGIFETYKNRLLSIDRVLSVVEASVDRRITRSPDGKLMMATDVGPGSRLTKDIALFDGVPTYAGLLELYKNPGDLILVRGEDLYFLRHHAAIASSAIEIDPPDAARRPGGGERLRVKGPATLVVTFSAGELGHVTFRLGSEGDGVGTFLCRAAAGTTAKEEFRIRRAFLGRLYALPCGGSRGAEIALPEGEHSVFDIRVYY